MDFDNIYEEYFDRVYYKVLSVVKNDDDAEDICQETFISVYKNLSKFREESNIYTWIYRIAINKTYDFFKKRKLEFEINDDVLSLPEDVNFDTKVILEEKLKLISEKEKEIVVLKDIYGYKLKEIAEMKKMNLSTVKSVYYKALKDMGGN
ncbi:RNA polymerase sigma factor [Fusobacterium nucleatum subsp. nucleatum ATCC 23726]|uniref:RNA polymerase sigma factor n=4 Tax=Fusobacterium TaxID=848 RepID=Q8RG39_FUSNN|nr:MULTISPECIES: RNA polymerase sigma factor [Fusobacterium]AAL94675.1 RNA polymerase sigma-E factor [Fusobacterium nucleatum subsp. nucleatum ATCC 25586]ALF23910.1 RNA polymerase subunit sigma [Fusobacterium nucleatum subsp. nucleatum ChDC F316]ASG26751.1 RNA polymerase sigma factor [Fusobacterium nucleatum subsp. nucleatum]AVQ14931.1 RNA polymerase sigma factor [Fusobacterium nucleatum subsp. nucleatum ATCC 25586]AVQ23800.1 RNA polymerase sigma factor [Fusobacterium nucleatum subsp. nucleatu